MRKIFKPLNKFIRAVLNILTRLLLSAAYLIVFLPFGILACLGVDFIGLRQKTPEWIPFRKIKDTNNFLKKQ